VFGWLANLVRVPDLRRRLLFTAGILAVYRFGSFLPAPGVDPTAAAHFLQSNGSTIFGLLNLLSGSSLSRLSLFALGIVPFVTASIAVQVLAAVVPSLKQLQKEGEAGYARLTQYTRYATVGLAAAQAAGYAFIFNREAGLKLDAGRFVLVVLTLTAGTALLMWLGEQITKRGIGNGISILIFASILASAPTAIRGWLVGSTTERLFFPIAALLVLVSVVFVQDGLRKIPVQYARRTLGRRTVGGGSTYMPLRVNMAGVIPVIFAAALLALPPTLAGFAPSTATFVDRYLQGGSTPYLVAEALLIVAFTFFYTRVQFDPDDQADNLRKYGGYLPGIRPGPPTAGYLGRVLRRLTLAGGLFLAAVAVTPCLFTHHAHLSQATSRALGGTSVLIVVGVALDTFRQMESQVTVRRHEGFLKS
jgi:preprotein translocase subunit SecY